MADQSIKRAKSKAYEYDQHLVESDKRFRHTVALQHGDGTFMFLKAAFAMTVDGVWVAVFTEHHGYFVYHSDDVVVTYDHEMGAL